MSAEGKISDCAPIAFARLIAPHPPPILAMSNGVVW